MQKTIAPQDDTDDVHLISDVLHDDTHLHDAVCPLHTNSLMKAYAHSPAALATEELTESSVQEHAALHYHEQSSAVLGAIVLSIILVAGLGMLIRRKMAPRGTVTLVLTALVASIAFMREGKELVPAAIAAGILGDIMLAYIPRTQWWMRAWCFVLPFLYYTFVVITLNITADFWWSIHMQAGLPVITGFAGLLTSLLLFRG